MYCGDETGAFIGDVGAHTSRFGYGGEDCPKVVVPSASYLHLADGGGSSGGSGSNGARNGDNGGVHVGNRNSRYSSPVSLMKLPPEDCCIYPPSTTSDGESSGSHGSVGFLPIYQSMNSNTRQNSSSYHAVDDDGIIQDIDAWAYVWEYSYRSLCVRGKRKHTVGHGYHLSSQPPESSPGLPQSQNLTLHSPLDDDGPIDHPILCVDSTSTRNTMSSSFTLSPLQSQRKQQALILETLFESLSAPAVYLAPSATLSSFSYGRQTGLVVDVGHTGARVTPVMDGRVLRGGSVRSGRGGRWLGWVQKGVLEGEFSDAWDSGVGREDTGDFSNKTKSVRQWNGWNQGKNGHPPCQNQGVRPHYLLHSNPNEKSREKKIQLLKQSPFHSMTTHEVMYQMMTSSHITSLDVSMLDPDFKADKNSDDGNGKEGGGQNGAMYTIPFVGYGEKNDEHGDSDERSSKKMKLDPEGENAMDVEKMEEDEDAVNKSNGEDDRDGSSHFLPDGTRVNLTKSKAGKDLCRLPELLFSEGLPDFIQPNSHANNYYGSMLPLHQLVHQSLHQIYDADVLKEMCMSILLTGAASLFPAMDKRLSIEMGLLLPSSYKFKVVASKNEVERKYGAWIGGSILSSLGSFQQLWVSRKEYEELGADLCLQRFQL